MPFALQYVKKRTYFRKELVFEYMNQKGPILGLAAGLEFILHSNESNTADAAKGSKPLCAVRGSHRAGPGPGPRSPASISVGT